MKYSALTKKHRLAASGSFWWSTWAGPETQPSHAFLSPPPQILMALQCFHVNIYVLIKIKIFFVIPMMFSLKIWLILGLVETWQSKFPASDAFVNFSFRVFWPRLQKRMSIFPILLLIESCQSICKAKPIITIIICFLLSSHPFLYDHERKKITSSKPIQIVGRWYISRCQ